ncbi:putative inactive cadmium/zinc-transporting ATPase HMA3 [Amaranthus tricolor]|uniref:putative inactive cadmium/zinc-transporting ATPase HMA3 n=1 Tax=Amaranthus tricolor TaxID=29722 RepID=UPI002587FC06|nr:putative inactive cadmium/zinc-transporting ATPase HMA3 [Amaranthus tricolor]
MDESVKNNLEKEKKKKSSVEKSYFDVLGLCCSSEVALIEKILKPLEGVIEVSVIVPSRTVIVLHDTLSISSHQIVKALNQARLEANVRVIGKTNNRGRWPSPYVISSGLLLAFSFLKYVYHPLEWLAVAAVAVGVWPILLRGSIAIRNFTIDVNILMLIAVIGTIVLKDYLEAGTIVFLFTIAEWLESRASQKATAVMSSLLSMTPQQATLAETGETVNVKDVKIDTLVAVKAGELIPIDGIVVEGTCEVDEKTLTGESYPVPKHKDSTVWAGTVNVNGYVSVKTTGLAEDSAVAKLARLVEEAQKNQSSVQRLIDKCAKYYTPGVILISAGIAAVAAAMKLHDRKHWFYLALVVLVSACPCGLILSTPVATFCALSRAATSGLLIKGGDYLEILAKIKHIAFDKTGTLTRGEFSLKNFQSLSVDVTSATLLYWVSSIESKSSHPIASVLVDYGKSRGVESKPENVEDFQSFPGEGVSGRINGRYIYIGNQKLGQRANCTAATTIAETEDQMKEALTCGYIYCDGTIIGSFSLTDDCRSGAAEAIKELKSMGVRTSMLTGDSRSTAMRAHEQLRQALDAVHAELLPKDKAVIITNYKKEGPTAMVGDGVNDAPALATADVGISMGVSGSALATETGHVVLMSNDIRKIPKAIKLARKTRRKVIENIIFSIATKAGVLAFAFAGHPLIWLAVLVDVLTCLIVIGNSMLLLGGSDHSHGSRRCFGLFSSGHSHKTKCCSKTALPKSCEAAKCSSQSCSATPCQNTEHRPCKTVKCSSQSCTTTPCRTSKSHSYGPADCSLQNCLTTPCQSTNLKSCCSTTTCHTTTPEYCQPVDCSSPTCTTPSGSKYHFKDQAETLTESESPKCCQTANQHFCHDTHENHCDAHECASESQFNDPHSSRLCKGNALSNEDHYLDILESQAGSFVKQDNSEIEEHHDHLGVNQHCQQKSSCCDKNTDGVKMKFEGQTRGGHHCSPVINELHNKNNVSRHEHCQKSDEMHHAAHHHHHHVLSHQMCHSNVVAHHVCNSLRKREIRACCKSFRKECCGSSQGHIGAAFGGLTEIITE